ncbi:MAG: hypothetical protein NZ899_13885 [Thermoguttaceae bacterium]|nr:hypothetical protein [Thermoguttaceae bacterium]MDW8080152.1 hypothetical protein [Thermoguttaceae bacterium]
MDDALATMLTLVTRGNQLTENDLDWVDQQMILPAVPAVLPDAPAEDITGDTLIFANEHLHRIGAIIGAALVRQAQVNILALTVQPWYVHMVYQPASTPPDRIRMVAEDALRRLFQSALPIWAPDYAKRFLFEEEEVASWVDYIERHNQAAGWEPRPWPFIARPCKGSGA